LFSDFYDACPPEYETSIMVGRKRKQHSGYRRFFNTEGLFEKRLRHWTQRRYPFDSVDVRSADMGSIAKKFLSRTLMLVQLLSLGYLALPLSVAAQTSSEAVIVKRELKQGATNVQPRQKQAARDQDDAKIRARAAREFETLLVEATAQRTIIDQWRKAHSKRPDWENLDR
jgi:hypothetical protein